MSPDGDSKGVSLAEAAMLLGAPDESAMTALDLGSLQKRTHRQLLEVSRLLGLQGVSKLNKDGLAERLLRVFASRKAVPEPPTAGEDAGLVTHKFELGERAPAGRHVGEPEPRDIPWSYALDRVTVMAVDPDRLCCYWEVTDDAIDRARQQLGRGGPGAWLSLRVYDTTGRLFDGTNAHSYFDHKVERHDRQWLFAIGKPRSEALVEVGLKSDEGYFVKIARSGRIEFPSREPAAWAEPEWLTVHTATGQAQYAGRGTPASASPSASESPPGGSQAARFEPVPLWQMRTGAGWEERFAAGEVGREEIVTWEQSWKDGMLEAHRTFSWESPLTVSSWQAGPFSYPVEVLAPTVESHESPVRVFRESGRTHVVYGPWAVIVRGLGAHYSRQVLARWEIHRSWVAEEGQEVRGVRTMRALGGASEGLLAGASERRWLGQSELRLRGASERFFVGASERLLMGASETLFAAASELRLRGASERLLMGASELALRGASERLFAGASERLLGGASELRLGASENLYPTVPPTSPPPK